MISILLSPATILTCEPHRRSSSILDAASCCYEVTRHSLCMPTHAADLIRCEVGVVLVVGPTDVLALWAVAAHDADRRSSCLNLHRAADALHRDRQLDVTRGPAAALHRRSVSEEAGEACWLPDLKASQCLRSEKCLLCHLPDARNGAVAMRSA
jgi:hypothetical protein